MAVTIVSVAVSLLLEASAESSLVYDRVIQKRESVEKASVILFSQKEDGVVSLPEDSLTPVLGEAAKYSARLSNERASFALQNGANMFLNLKKSVVTIEGGSRVEFYRFDKF